ncbi:MAG TPA: TraR/DksA family transcriptional regulator [Steroidobacteraceae bacterium]|jgi:RNA polymerase-binding protein DksA|nr:TraR/DksA family transcriptional regulator [Steroidobacteraceae bacterium]
MTSKFEPIREKLLQQKQELLARAAKVHADITRSSGPLDKDFAEQVVQMENDAVLAGISEATAAELAQINRALAQIEQGSYGICSQCGQPIGERRLQALPYSDRCITCAETAR